jgi:hypothetical protein
LLLAVALLWPGAVVAQETGRMICKMSIRCDGTGCAAQGLIVKVHGLPAEGDGLAVVDLGSAETGRPVQVLRRGGAVVMLAPNGPDGGITRTGHCDRPPETGT